MTKLKTPSQVIDALGGTSKAAQIFGVLPSAVSNWRSLGFSKAVRFDVMQECAKRGIDVAPSVYKQTGESNG